MLKVYVTDTKNIGKWFDLSDASDRQRAVHFTDTILDNHDDYTIKNIESDWAMYDAHTNISDMITVMTELERFSPFEQEIFYSLVMERIYAPEDILYRIQDGKILKNVDNDTEIWETVNIYDTPFYITS